MPIQVAQLLDRYGETYADEAGITLRDKPSPLFQVLVLTTLLARRIKADIAVAAARELFGAGWRTPAAMSASTWQDRVDALGRGHYVRYDESTSTNLGELAQRVLGQYRGDLRRLRSDVAGDPAALRAALTRFRGIGDVGGHIFCREIQVVWPELRPYFDGRALRVAADLDLPTEPKRLAEHVASQDIGRFAAALVRYGLQRRNGS